MDCPWKLENYEKDKCDKCEDRDKCKAYIKERSKIRSTKLKTEIENIFGKSDEDSDENTFVKEI